MVTGVRVKIIRKYVNYSTNNAIFAKNTSKAYALITEISKHYE